MGWVRPASIATSVSRHKKGRPEGLPRGCALTPREEIPWPNIFLVAPANATPAAVAIIFRRVIIVLVRPPLDTAALWRSRTSARFLRASGPRSFLQRDQRLIQQS